MQTLKTFSSDLAESKAAALSCLLECLKKYEPRHLEPHFKDIWNSCKQVRKTDSFKMLKSGEISSK